MDLAVRVHNYFLDLSSATSARHWRTRCIQSTHEAGSKVSSHLDLSASCLEYLDRRADKRCFEVDAFRQVENRYDGPSYRQSCHDYEGADVVWKAAEAAVDHQAADDCLLPTQIRFRRRGAITAKTSRLPSRGTISISFTIRPSSSLFS